MGPRLRLLSVALAVWSLLSVGRAIGVAEGLAAGEVASPARLWSEVLLWSVPVLLGGLGAVLAVSRTGDDVYLARNVRLGVMVAIFAVALSWMLVIYAGYLGTLTPP